MHYVILKMYIGLRHVCVQVKYGCFLYVSIQH